MKIVGLITEYNPFHNGHQYHIQQALKLSGADAAVVVMSGNFVQRGTPAFMPKHLRTEAALLSGAAAVFELPVCYATGSAEFFATGAVSLLEHLGCIHSLCFGAETADLELLQEIAQILIIEPEHYKERLQLYLKSGDTFPVARHKALIDYTNQPELSQALEQPNNILAIEYLKALLRLDSKMKPLILQRSGSGYHETSIQSGFASASAIRHAFSEQQTTDFQFLHRTVPENTISLFTDNWKIRFPVLPNDFSFLLKYKLLTLSKEELTQFADVTEDLANRIYKYRNSFLSVEQFCEQIKTKQMTHTRISRGLLHILLDISQKDMELYQMHDYHGYARLLGFRHDKKEVLSILKQTSTIPIISKLASCNQLEEPFCGMLKKDIFCSDLYESAITERYKTAFINEYKKPIVRI